MPFTKDTNMGVLIPMLLFLIAQSLGGVWWASSIHSAVEVQATNHGDLKRRVGAAEQAAAAVSVVLGKSDTRALQIDKDLGGLRQDLRETNSLLRDVLLRSTDGGFGNE